MYLKITYFNLRCTNNMYNYRNGNRAPELYHFTMHINNRQECDIIKASPWLSVQIEKYKRQ